MNNQYYENCIVTLARVSGIPDEQLAQLLFNKLPGVQVRIVEKMTTLGPGLLGVDVPEGHPLNQSGIHEGKDWVNSGKIVVAGQVLEAVEEHLKENKLAPYDR